jgi:hypothetical protein
VWVRSCSSCARSPFRSRQPPSRTRVVARGATTAVRDTSRPRRRAEAVTTDGLHRQGAPHCGTFTADRGAPTYPIGASFTPRSAAFPLLHLSLPPAFLAADERIRSLRERPTAYDTRAFFERMFYAIGRRDGVAL